MGLSTVHSDSAENTIDRLITLIKRDVRSQSYKESFIEKLLASSIDYIIYMKEYKVFELAEVSYDRKCEKVKLKTLYKLINIEDKYFKNLYK
ncbi:MAG: hypothetical protein RR290_02490 [Clostridia bacterium]